MTTIFTILNDLLQKKGGNLHTQTDFTPAVKSPYLLQRWVSMTTPANVELINETTNKIYSGLENKPDLWYKLFYTVIQKTPNSKKIQYIKKASEKTNETMEKTIEVLQKRNELSYREICEYLALEEEINPEFKITKYKQLTT